MQVPQFMLHQIFTITCTFPQIDKRSLPRQPIIVIGVLAVEIVDSLSLPNFQPFVLLVSLNLRPKNIEKENHYI